MSSNIEKIKGNGLNGEYKGGNGLEKARDLLIEYFDEKEADYYDFYSYKSARRKFIKWGEKMIKNGNCYKLFKYHLSQ
jgi:hypothetical protein